MLRLPLELTQQPRLLPVGFVKRRRQRREFGVGVGEFDVFEAVQFTPLLRAFGLEGDVQSPQLLPRDLT